MLLPVYFLPTFQINVLSKSESVFYYFHITFFVIISLTFEFEVDIGVAVSKGVEGVAPVHAGVRQARVLDGQR